MWKKALPLLPVLMLLVSCGPKAPDPQTVQSMISKGLAKGEEKLLIALCKDRDWVSGKVQTIDRLRLLAEESEGWTFRMEIQGHCFYQDLEGKKSQDRAFATRLDVELRPGNNGPVIHSAKPLLQEDALAKQNGAAENLSLCRDFLFQIQELQNKIKVSTGRFGDEKTLVAHGIPTRSSTGIYPPGGNLCKRWLLALQDQGFGYTLQAQPRGDLKDCWLNLSHEGQMIQRGACTYVSNLDENMYAQARLLICKAAVTSLRRGVVRQLDENKTLDPKTAVNEENLGINPRVLGHSCASIEVEGKGDKAALVARPPGLLRDQCQIRLPLFSEMEEVGDCQMKKASDDDQG